MHIVIAATHEAVRSELRERLSAAGFLAAREADEVALGQDRDIAATVDLVITGARWPDVRPFIQFGAHCRRPVAVLLEHPERGMAHPALREGAAALLPWEVSPAALAAALDTIAHGLRVVPGSGRSARPVLRAAGDTEPKRLSDREREVLEHVASGLPTKLIARQLGMSPNTVKQHVAGIFRKLGVHTRAEAFREAVRRGELTI